MVALLGALSVASAHKAPAAWSRTSSAPSLMSAQSGAMAPVRATMPWMSMLPCASPNIAPAALDCMSACGEPSMATIAGMTPASAMAAWLSVLPNVSCAMQSAVSEQSCADAIISLAFEQHWIIRPATRGTPPCAAIEFWMSLEPSAKAVSAEMAFSLAFCVLSESSASSGLIPPASMIDTRLSAESRARLASAAAACSCAEPEPSSLLASNGLSKSIDTSFLMMSTRLAFSIDRRTNAPSACSRARMFCVPRSCTNGPMPPASVISSRLPALSAKAYSAPAASSCASSPWSPPSRLTSGEMAPTSAMPSATSLRPLESRASADAAKRRPVSSPLTSSCTSGVMPPVATIWSRFSGSSARSASAAPANSRAPCDAWSVDRSRMKMSGEMPPALAIACCASALPKARRCSACAACSRLTVLLEVSIVTSGATPPSLSTTSWLSAPIESESAHSEKARASSLPALSRWMTSWASPAPAIAARLSGFSCTSRHKELAALDFASIEPLPSMPTSSAVICSMFSTLSSPSAASACFAFVCARALPSARRLTSEAIPPALAIEILLALWPSARAHSTPAASARTASSAPRKIDERAEMAPYSETAVWLPTCERQIAARARDAIACTLGSGAPTRATSA